MKFSEEHPHPLNMGIPLSPAPPRDRMKSVGITQKLAEQEQDYKSFWLSKVIEMNIITDRKTQIPNRLNFL